MLFRSEAASAPTTDVRELLLNIGLALTVDRQGVIATLNLGRVFALAMGSTGDAMTRKSAPITITLDQKNYGHEMRLCVPPPNQSGSKRHPKLFELIIRAFAARNYLMTVDGDVAARDASTPHLLRIARLAYLAPDIIASIIDGKQPSGLTARALAKAASLPLSWNEQRRMLGFA